MSLTIWQYLQSVIVALDGQAKASEQQARDLAGAFLFSGIEQDKTLGDVSGGERSRAVLAGLVAGAHNLLVLDEPTNHLDIPSSERLERSLAADGGYSGALLLISHDRALLEATCEKLIIFDGLGDARLFQGRYSDWERRRDTAAAPPEAPPAPGNDQPQGRKGKQQKQQQKQRPQQKPKGPKRVFGELNTSDLEARIETIEERMRAIDQKMIDPHVYADRDRFRTLSDERESLQKTLTPLEEEWSRRA
jgi:ATP-binding cassette subfamily F protein 3